MRFLEINSVCGIRSTGRIVADIAEDFINKGGEVVIAYGREIVPEKYAAISHRITSKFGNYIAGFKARIFDNEGFNCRRETKKFLKWADEFNPDVLHLHNLHGYYINIELLFNWIKTRPDMEVRWTLHDCWAFTGHCCHFSFVKCYKWASKDGCGECPQKREYPSSSFMDGSARNFNKKKELFTGVKNMTIITPSLWLSDLVKRSFLGGYKVEVRHNTIDTASFKPTPSNFREKNGLIGKKIVLGVATAWSERKGLMDFIKLSEMLDENIYKIVLVGLSCKQIKTLPERIVGIERTNSKTELAEIYTAADVFVNPSREESFGLTTLEAISCGTPVVVYKGTACEEVVGIYGGEAVEQNVEALCGKIKSLLD